MTADRQAKQVIVMRNDLGMRKGKMIAQGAHSSIAFLTQHGNNLMDAALDGSKPYLWAQLTPAQAAWIKGIFKKICVRVDSEEELLEITEKAKQAGLTVALIQDAGLTEFGGVPTYTCCALGPDWEDEIDAVTGDLKLL